MFNLSLAGYRYKMGGAFGNPGTASRFSRWPRPALSPGWLAWAAYAASFTLVILHPLPAKGQQAPVRSSSRDTLHRPPAAARFFAQGADSVRLSLGEARALALGNNPELLAARLDTAIARGELHQAGLLLRFNPEADVLGAGAEDGLEVGISQELEIFGQQGARRGAAQGGLERTRSAASNASRVTLGELDRAFHRLVAATRRRDLARDVLGLNRRLAEVAGRQLQEGEIGRLDFNLASIELGRSRARVLAVGRELIEAGVELGRIVGLPPRTTVIPVVDSTLDGPPTDSSAVVALVMSEEAVAGGHFQLNADSLTAVALGARPDLEERGAARRQAMALATLAGREALPNLVFRGVSERQGGTARTFRPGVGLTLPFFNRNRGEVAARRAATQQAEMQHAALAARVRAEVASAIAAYEAAATEVALLEATVLQPARQNRRLVETAYREGKVGIAELLLIRNQAIEAELDYWAAWLGAREALATMAEVTGQNLSTPPAAAPR